MLINTILKRLDNILDIQNEGLMQHVFLGTGFAQAGVVDAVLTRYFDKFPGMFTWQSGNARLKVIPGELPVSHNEGVAYIQIVCYSPAKNAVFHTDYAEDASPEKEGLISTDTGVHIGKFRTDDELIAHIQTLYPLDELKTHHGAVLDEQERQDSEVKKRWDSVIQQEKTKAGSTGFTYKPDTVIDSEEMLRSFMGWIYLDSYDIINRPGSNPHYQLQPGIVFQHDVHSLTLFNIWNIQVRFRYRTRFESGPNKEVSVTHLTGTPKTISTTAYVTQSDLYHAFNAAVHMVYIQRSMPRP